VAKVQRNSTFAASPKQMQFAEIYLDYDQKLTNKEIAEKIGVERTTIWHWFQKDDFVTWINSQKDKMLSKSLSDRYKTAIRKAKAGDFQFSKLLFEMQGEYVQKTENKNINVETDFEELTDQEMVEEFGRDLDRYKAITDRQGRAKGKIKADKKSQRQ